jgi:trehalose synthase
VPLDHIEIAPLSPERFRSILAEGQMAELEASIERAAGVFHGRVVWNVNSTARGGGVAEMLHSLVAYTRGAGVDARWVVIHGEPDFFRVTKRIHNRLHGSAGDGGPLGPEERAAYERTAGACGREMAEIVRPGDVVLLHDPQTAGLAGPLRAAGARVVWRSHVGLDLPNELAREAWRFLHPYVVQAQAYVFSRQAYVWEDLDPSRAAVIPPSIDAFSPKNQQLSREAVDAILATAGLEAGGSGAGARFEREDGTPGRVDRQAELIEDEPLRRDRPLVLQVSRWDRLKDPLGVMDGFAEHVAQRADADLLLAGPEVTAVSDDPEGAEVLAEARERRETLPSEVRKRVHLACLPMSDAEENAAMVNALQRRADVVTQKSLAEGFGLTVSEAMWKARPVVASRVGGIQDQITDGETGTLVEPHDLEAFGSAIAAMLADADVAAKLGARAQARVRDSFLGARHLEQYVDLLEPLLAER